MTERNDGIALDRESVRQTDADGRMHVSATNISKANVCPYYGREIPNYEALGLKPDLIYQLYRDPAELERAAPTFNNLPLLDRHVPVSADAPHQDRVVGSTGTDAAFVAPYLKNSLVIWKNSAIAGVESDEQRELSSAYRYRADMTPGIADGVPYDGVMRDIVGNHVALVERGRAGPDVLVGDAALTLANDALNTEERNELTDEDFAVPGKRKLPIENEKHIKLAWDLLNDTEGLTVEEKAHAKTRILHAAKAHGMDISDWQGAKDAAFAVFNTPKGSPMAATRKARVNARLDALKPYLAADADLEKLRAAFDAEEKAKDEDDEDDKKKPSEEVEPVEDDDDKDDDKVQKAMDSAVTAAVARVNQMHAALRDVRPFVGEIAAMDSADAVYKFALDAMGVDTKDVHPSAFKAILKAQSAAVGKPRIAQDAAAMKPYADTMAVIGRVRKA